MRCWSISAAARIWWRCWRIATTRSILAHRDNTVDLDGMNYVALRAYKAAGQNVSFNEMSRMTGAAPVTGALIPILVSFADLSNPATARTVPPDNLAAVLGQGFRLHRMTAEVVPNGIWPLDFGGRLGEPVTRGIEAKLPWWNGTAAPAATALRAAGVPAGAAIDPREVFTRK